MTSPDPSITDEELMSRLLTRDEEAFSCLYERFAPRLLGVACAVLRDRKEAEDILQESFLHFWNHADRFDATRGKAFTWAVLTVRHRSIDRLRGLARRDPARFGPDALPEIAPVESLAPDQEAAGKDRFLNAKSMLKSLPDVQREMLSLAFLSGLTHPEIAAKLALPLGTVKTTIRRGLQRVRNHFQSSPEDPS